MNTPQIDLTEDLKQFIHREVASGRFRSPNEVIEAGLPLLEERESRLAALRTAIEQDDHSIGAAGPTERRT